MSETEKLKVLVVDDEQAIAQITSTFLARKNYAAFVALNAQEAITLFNQEHPQLVLLDLRLGMDSGLDVLRQIKQIDPQVKVVMVTGLGDDESVAKAKELGTGEFLIKPFTAAVLLETVARLLGPSA